MIEKNYSIHDIVTFKIVNKTKFFERYFCDLDIAYKNFESEEEDDPDFVLYLGNFVPNIKNCYIQDDRYYIRKDYFYCKDSRKIVEWEIEMSEFEGGKMIVHISSNLGMFILPIIDSLIHFKMNEKGYTLVHASCVSHDGLAYLFSARSGGGKTTIALNLVEKGFDFLGDNFTILHENKVLSFPSALNIFNYNLAPIIKDNLGIKDKITLDLKSLLYKMTLGYAKIFTKINVKDVFPNLMVDESKLGVIFLLIPKEELYVEKMKKEELISILVANQKLDSFPFLKYMLEYSYTFPDSNMATHWERYKENLGRNLSGNIPIYKVEVPQKYDRKVFEEILKVIQHETNIKL